MLPELLWEPELGVVDFPVGVVGFSSFLLLLLLVEGVLELEEPPLLGLRVRERDNKGVRWGRITTKTRLSTFTPLSLGSDERGNRPDSDSLFYWY
jgi:hypothetical protein